MNPEILEKEKIQQGFFFKKKILSKNLNLRTNEI